MSRRSPRSSAEVRHLVVQAATALFAERGYARVATRDIAKRADVTPSQLFAQFGTKARLYEVAIVAPYLETVSSFAERWRGDPVSAVAPEEVYRVLVSELFEVTDTEPGLMTALIIAQAHEESLVSEIAPSLRQIDAALRPLEELVGGPEPDEPVLAVRLTHGTVMAAVQFRSWLATHLPDRESTVAAMTDLFTHGVGVGDPPATEGTPGTALGVDGCAPGPGITGPGEPASGMRARLLTAAAGLFEQGGYPGVSTRSIAEAAGTSETILFRHFATKLALFDHAVTRPWAEEVTCFVADHQRVDGLGELVTDLYRLFHRRRPALIALLEFERQAPRPAGAHTAVTALLDLVGTRLPAGQEHRDATAALIVAAILGAAVLDVWLFTGHLPGQERVIAGLLELIETGVRTR